MSAWRTRLPRGYARRFGCIDPLHVAVFEHRDDLGGASRCVAVQLPETPAPLIAEALILANACKARILAVADTAEQIEAIVNRIALTCAHHRRVPYERAAAGRFGPLI